MKLEIPQAVGWRGGAAPLPCCYGGWVDRAWILGVWRAEVPGQHRCKKFGTLVQGQHTIPQEDWTLACWAGEPMHSQTQGLWIDYTKRHLWEGKSMRENVVRKYF